MESHICMKQPRFRTGDKARSVSQRKKLKNEKH